jgi:glycine cleavage system transcriptional repressor
MSSERRHMVLTAVGPDRPGLVQELSAAIAESSVNLEDSRMAILGGEFALIVLLSGAPAALSRVSDRCTTFEARLGLRVSLKETAVRGLREPFLPYRLRVTGEDRPGIVAKVSKVVAVKSINVASLESRLVNAPESGTPMFHLTVELQFPSEAALLPLRAELRTVCDEENLDLTLEPIR